MRLKKKHQRVKAGLPEQSFVELRRARAQVAVSQMRAAAQARGADKLTPAEIETEIKLARRSRKKRETVKK